MDVEEFIAKHSPDKLSVIGFDLGHGKTSLVWGRADLETVEPEIIEIQKKRFQMTAFARLENGKPIIGEQAYLSAAQEKVKEFEICFKRRLNDDPEHQKIVADFVKAVFTELEEREETPGGERIFFVGRPSGWDKLAEDWGQQKFDLGASLIDKAILERSITESKNRKRIEEFFKINPSAKKVCEILCRRAKEIYFSCPENFQDPNYYVKGFSEALEEDLYFDPRVNKRIMEKILSYPLRELGKRSWRTAFLEELENARDKCQQYQLEPYAIIRTGGANRMDFVQQQCQEVFPQTKLILDAEPELCVVRGLTRWSRVYVKTAQFKSEINKFLDKDLEKAINTSTLFEHLAEDLANSIMNDVVESCVYEWRRRDIYTLNGLESRIEVEVKDWLTGSQGVERIKEGVKKWQKEIFKSIEQKTQPICTKYNLPLDTFDFGEVRHSVNTDSFNWTLDTNYLVVQISGIAVFIASSLIAIIIALLVGAFAWLGASPKSMDIPRWIRNFVSSSNIDRALQENIPQLKTEIQKTLNDDRDLANKITQKVRNGLKPIIEKRTEDARLLLI